MFSSANPAKLAQNKLRLMTSDSIDPEARLTQQSVTLLLGKVRSKDEAAIADLWAKYWTQLVMAAQRQCQYQTALVDPEFIAQSVFNHVCNQFQRGNMADISDREQFWAILLNLTKNKAIDHFRKETRQKRGGHLRRVALTDGENQPVAEPFRDREQLEDRDASELLDHFLFLLNQEDPTGTLTQILLGRLAGESNPAIAKVLDVSTRTVDRKIERIRLVLESSSL